MGMFLHAADSVYKDAMVPANSRHVGPNLALNFFGYRLTATCCAENDVLVVLGEGVRHVPPLRGSSYYSPPPSAPALGYHCFAPLALARRAPSQGNRWITIVLMVPSPLNHSSAR